MSKRLKTAPQCVRTLIAAVALTASGVPLFAQETIRDEEHGFTLTVPKGFVPAPKLAPDASDIIHSFVKGDPTDDRPDIMLFVEKMGGTIGRERLRAF